MSDEQWILLILSVLGNVGVAVWALVKNLIPTWQQAGIAEKTDEREHRQTLEEARQRYSILNEAYTSDRLSVLLEENESFIRERVWEELAKISERQRKTEYTMAQTRDTLAILCSAIEELREVIKRNGRMDKEQDSSG